MRPPRPSTSWPASAPLIAPQISTFWDDKIISKILLTIVHHHNLNIFGPDCTDWWNMTILGCLGLSALLWLPIIAELVNINGKEKLSNYNQQLNVKRNKKLPLKRYGFLSVCQPLICTRNIWNRILQAMDATLCYARPHQVARRAACTALWHTCAGRRDWYYPECWS